MRTADGALITDLSSCEVLSFEEWDVGPYTASNPGTEVSSTTLRLKRSLFRNQYRKLSERCSAGADKWLHRKTWQYAEECFPVLRSMGYRIIATATSSDAVAIQVDALLSSSSAVDAL